MLKTSKERPLFSILTVTLNGEKYLAESLQSVASQTSQDFEHLLFDGGSQDATLEIARSFEHVQVIEGKDLGISDAMNQIASHAMGDYIIHLHADDRLATPQVLEKVAVTLKQHPGIAWLYGRANMIDEKGDCRRITPFIEDATARLWKYNTLTHPSVVISRELFLRSSGFKTDLRLAMDYDLWIRLSQMAPAFAYPDVIGSFREHTGSLSTSRPLEVAREAYLVRNRYLKNPWKKFRSYRTYKRRISRCA